MTVSNKIIDLRSDTVTRPSTSMKEAMLQAEVGDDVWGDDPTVKTLETQVAELLGKEAGLFVASGTQGNLCALMSHCQRGDEYIVGAAAHTYRYEAGGGAVLGSIQPQPVRITADGSLDLDEVEAVIKPDDPHFARSRLLCLENTHDGKAQPLKRHVEAKAIADKYGLALHLDGARLWNAAVALDVPLNEMAAPFDTVSVCLSKGLGAPVGSVLVGSAELIERAYRWRKMLGGAMRQSGILAAAGIYAVDHNIDRLSEDHDNAARLAAALGELPSVEVEQNTNMVFVQFGPHADSIRAAFEASSVKAAIGEGLSRLVTHLDVDSSDIDKVIDVTSTTIS